MRRIPWIAILLLGVAVRLPAEEISLRAAASGDLLREGPGLGYAHVQTLREGEPLRFVLRDGNWVHVRTAADVEGWIHASFLEGLPEEPAAEQVDPREERRRRKAAEEARRRADKEAMEAKRRAEREERSQAEGAEGAEETQRLQAEAVRRAREEERMRRDEARRREAEAARRAEGEKRQRAAQQARLREVEEAADREEIRPVQPSAGDAGGTQESRYDPLESDRILDEVVAGIYEEDRMGPGVVRTGPEAPAVPSQEQARAAARNLPSPDRGERRPVVRTEPRMREEIPPSEPESPEPYRPDWRSLPPPEPGSMVLEEVVARVNDDVITKSELDERLRILDRLPDTMAPALEGIDPEEVRANLLPRMVGEKLLIQRAEELGVNKERVYQAGKKDFQERYGIQSDLELIAFLESSGLDLGDFRSILLRSYLPPLVLEKEVRGSVQVSSEDVRTYYEEHPEEFLLPELVRLREIVLLRRPEESEADLRRRLALALSRIEGGASFEMVAAEVSDAPSAEKGGDLGLVRPSELSPALAQRIGRTVEGEMAVERTDYGYHVLLLVDRRPEGPASLEEAEKKIRAHLRKERYQREFEEYMEELRRRNFIQINPEYAARYGDFGGRG